MSRSAVYCVLIRNGERRWFAEVWGELRRELVWGPDAFESWCTAGEEIDAEPEDVCGAAIVDFDAKTLVWGEQEVLTPPRANELYCKLLENAWPGFSITKLPSSRMSTALYSLLDDGEEPAEQEDAEDDGWEERPHTIKEAAEYFYPSQADEDDEDDLEEPFSEDRPGAWLTIVDEQGKLRQRGLSAISVDLLSGDENAVQELVKLDPVELPEEKFVDEGMWIHMGERKIGYWGSEADPVVGRLRAGWPKWEVEAATLGYVQQCQLSGLPGKPMSDAEALGQFLPQVLSNKRMSMANLFGAMGGSLKKTAIKATGCLIIVLSLPILLTGFFMDMWKEAGIALLTLVIIVAVLFKLVELKIKSRFRQSGFAKRDEAAEMERPPVAGPQDELARKQRLSELLAACGLPALTEIEPHFEDAGEIV